MDIKKSIKGISPTGKVLIGALLVGGAIWAWYYFKKKNEPVVQTEPSNTNVQPTLVDEATMQNLMNQPASTDQTQATADEIASHYVQGRAAALPQNVATNNEISSKLAAMGFRVDCATTGADNFICKAVKL